MHEGFVIDLFGLLPLNLILGIIYPHSQIKQMRYVFFISALRLLRMVSSWRMFMLIDEFTIYLKSASYYVILIKAVSIWFGFGHFMACSWYFLNSVVERDRKELTWAIEQDLPNRSTAERYLLSFYFVLNIVHAGSGDMMPYNELERLVTTILITLGDVLWSFGFGLIAYFWELKRSMTERKESLENKINALQELMDAKEISNNSKPRIEKYFAYHFYKQQNSWAVDKRELMHHLPVAVV